MVSKKTTVPVYQANMLPEYDVFLSHANKDKADLVDELNTSLEKLGVKNIFMIKNLLNGGDKWKETYFRKERKKLNLLSL